MARKLIREQALAQAMRIFWLHGYNGTSMEMLTKGLGVEKPSLYAAFGNKHSLFLAALLYYRTSLIDRVHQFLISAPTPGNGINRIVRFMMTSLHQPGIPDGCFASNSALELADHDAEVAEHVTTMLKELGALFELALLDAQAKGEVTRRVPAKVLADFLINAIEGVRIVEKTHPGRDALDALVDFVLAALDP